MSNPPIRPIPTLKGILSMPRSVRGRNFLKENKLSLRQLEKSTIEKLAAKEPVRPKWMPTMQRSGSEILEGKAPGRPKKTQGKNSRKLGVAGSEAGEHFDDTASEYLPSEEADKDVVAQSQDNYSEYCSSCGTQRSTTSIGTQTEDITDERYLTNALKKCTFDAESLASNRYYDNNDTEARKNLNDWSTMPLPDDDLQTEVASDDEEPSLSARSRYTVATMASSATSTTSLTSSKRREHKLGSRDQLRLPRYLAKKKRATAAAAAKVLADAPDPDCPRGHCLLSEQQRLSHLNNAQKRYDGLIREVNHMPITSQSLWVRTRKAEIDKELDTVDGEIRFYSKPKVYIESCKSVAK